MIPSLRFLAAPRGAHLPALVIGLIRQETFATAATYEASSF